MKHCIAGAAALAAMCLPPAQHATAQILDLGPFESMDIEGVHTFDEVTIRGGRLNFTGDTVLRVLGDFQLLNEPTSEGTARGFLGIDDGDRGTRGAFGACCDDGADGNTIVPDGQPGGPGGDGGDGTDAVSNVTTVRINAGGDIVIDGRIGSSRVAGGNGGFGGEGGNGGNGLDRQFSGIASGPGGSGGSGASGGNGGNAGQSEEPLDVILNALGMITFGPGAGVSLRGARGGQGGSADEGGDGGRGGNATLGSGFNGGNGASGGTGGNGGDGADGVRGGDIYMMAPTIQVLNALTHPMFGDFLNFVMPGGDGGSGNDGGQGGPGGSGGDAGSFAGNGGFGGNGGHGGDGGDGGDGARGGNLILRGVDVMLAADAPAPGAQSGGRGGSAGSGGPGEDGGSGGLGGLDFLVQAPNGLNGGAGVDGQPGEDAADGTIDITLLDAGAGPSVGNGGFSNGLANYLELGEGTASTVLVNGDPALQMEVDVGPLSLTQIVGTDGASGVQFDLDYAFVTPVGTLEVRLDDNLVLSITPTGVSSPEATPVVTPGVPFNHVSVICPTPVADDTVHELTLRLLPGSPATVQVDNLALQSAALTPAVDGDVDGDGDVDLDDINLILAVRNQPASGADDPRDLDGDGIITVLDARIAATMCTRPRCATA